MCLLESFVPARPVTDAGPVARTLSSPSVDGGVLSVYSTYIFPAPSEE